MQSHVTTLLAWLALVITGGTGKNADVQAKPVTAKERASVMQALNSIPEFVNATKDKKVVASTIVQYPGAPETNAQETVVESLYYDYTDGKTIRATLNLSERKLLRLDLLEAYPTPLAPEEIETARKIAEKKDPRVKSLVEKFGERGVTTEALAPVVSDKGNPLYGKRLAILFLTPKDRPRETVSVKVNLTDGTVKRN